MQCLEIARLQNFALFWTIDTHPILCDWIFLKYIIILYFVEVNIGEIMDVMQDLSNLKLAIQSNNKEHVENIYELYKQEVPSFLHKFSSEQLNRLEMDTMASVLIPFDLPLPLHEVFAVKSLGNGNCLFNSV